VTIVAADELRRAVEADELVLFYQPQVDMRSGIAVGVEACLRWKHPKRGLLHASAFVDAVPQAGLAREFMRWIIAAATRQMAEWRAAAVPLGRVSINTWPVSLTREIVSDVLSAVAAAGLDPSDVEVETPPEATYDPETLAIVSALRDAGIRTAFDDFGDGHIRFTWLRDARFDVVKVPLTFVLGDVGPFDDAVVRSAIAFAHAIGAVVVAEGVETRGARDRVLGLGCDIGQGYWWSRVIPADEIPRVLAAIRVDGAEG